MEQTKGKKASEEQVRAREAIEEALGRLGGSERSGAATLQWDLARQLMASVEEANPRGLGFMLAYYGLAGRRALTLEAIGRGASEPLTRERVRQIIDGALATLLERERAGGKKAPKAYAKAKEAFEKECARSQAGFLPLAKLSALPYFEGFAENEKGLIAFLSDAGVRQVVYRGERYVYPQALGREAAIEQIQASNKKQRRARTVEKMKQMAKTVTYVPEQTREALAAHAQSEGVALNRLYESILLRFIEEKPYQNAQDFAKTKSWRARQGKAQWRQVGIYIDKRIFEQAKEAAGRVSAGRVSNMSFICHAFVWFCGELGLPLGLDEADEAQGGEAPARPAKRQSEAESAAS
jgi:hypothetical protein